MSSRNHYKNRISQGENQLCKRGNLDVFIKLNKSYPKSNTMTLKEMFLYKLDFNLNLCHLGQFNSKRFIVPNSDGMILAACDD